MASLKGTTVILKCHSEVAEEMLNCAWTREDVKVEVMDRYSYLKDDYIKSKDCSIRIEQLQDVDTGHWKCHIYTVQEPNDATEIKHSWLELYGKHDVLHAPTINPC